MDYPDNVRRFAFFALASLTVLPRLVSRTGPDPRPRLAHRARPRLPPHHLRLGDVSRPRRPPWCRCTTRATRVTYPPEVVPEIGLPWEVYNWRQLEWYGKLNFLKGGLVFTDMVTTVSPTQARELRTVGGGFGLHEVFRLLGDRLVGVLNGIDQHAWNPADDPQITATYSPGESRGQAKVQGGAAALVRAAAAPQHAALRDDGAAGHPEGTRPDPRAPGNSSPPTRSSSFWAPGSSGTNTRWSISPPRRPTGSASSSTSPTGSSTG